MSAHYTMAFCIDALALMRLNRSLLLLLKAFSLKNWLSMLGTLAFSSFYLGGLETSNCIELTKNPCLATFWWFCDAGSQMTIKWESKWMALIMLKAPIKSLLFILCSSYKISNLNLIRSYLIIMSSPSRDGDDILNCSDCYNTKNWMLIKMNKTPLKIAPNTSWSQYAT